MLSEISKPKYYNTHLKWILILSTNTSLQQKILKVTNKIISYFLLTVLYIRI